MKLPGFITNVRDAWTAAYEASDEFAVNRAAREYEKALEARATAVRAWDEYMGAEPEPEAEPDLGLSPESIEQGAEREPEAEP
jgi:hypothetical protein